MEALLATDASVSVSFICEGSIPEGLPKFVEIRPPKVQGTKPTGASPFYGRRVPQLPDALSRTIMRTNRFALSKVSVRENFRINGSRSSIMLFLFTNSEELVDNELHAQGLTMLDQMLRVPWRRIFIFRKKLENLQTMVNISIGKNILLPEGAVFAEPDSWGIRTLH